MVTIIVQQMGGKMKERDKREKMRGQELETQVTLKRLTNVPLGVSLNRKKGYWQEARGNLHGKETQRDGAAFSNPRTPPIFKGGIEGESASRNRILNQKTVLQRNVEGGSKPRPGKDEIRIREKERVSGKTKTRRGSLFSYE